MNQSPFFVKLCELEQEEQRLRECLRLCGALRPDELRRSRQAIQRECGQDRMRLEEDIWDSRSPAVAKLAEAQRTYCLTAQRLMEESLPGDLHSEGSTPDEDRAEAGMLYAEYAIDFARQSIRHALLAALSAMEAQYGQEDGPAGGKEETEE